MSKYLANPVTIDAQQIVDAGDLSSEGSYAELYPLVLDNGTNFNLPKAKAGGFTPEASDYIIFGENEDTYLCKKAVFEAKYSPVYEAGELPVPTPAESVQGDGQEGIANPEASDNTEEQPAESTEAASSEAA